MDASQIERTWLDLAYASQSPTRLSDIYLPGKGIRLFPVTVTIHGGAWKPRRLQSRNGQTLEIANEADHCDPLFETPQNVVRVMDFIGQQMKPPRYRKSASVVRQMRFDPSAHYAIQQEHPPMKTELTGCEQRGAGPVLRPDPCQ